MISLRQRIRKTGISPQPWRRYKGEIRLLPISAQTLFKNKGLPWDIWETELKSEGFLSEEENLWVALSSEKRLMSKIDADVCEDPWDETWTEEDFIHFYSKDNNIL